MQRGSMVLIGVFIGIGFIAIVITAAVLLSKSQAKPRASLTPIATPHKIIRRTTTTNRPTPTASAAAQRQRYETQGLAFSYPKQWAVTASEPSHDVLTISPAGSTSSAQLVSIQITRNGDMALDDIEKAYATGAAQAMSMPVDQAQGMVYHHSFPAVPAQYTNVLVKPSNTVYIFTLRYSEAVRDATYESVLTDLLQTVVFQ